MTRALLAGLCLLACGHSAPVAPPERSYPTGNEARLATLVAGQTPPQVQLVMGEERIPDPLEAGDSFANPHLEVALADEHGDYVRIWLYLTELRTHPECPYLTYTDRPVVFEGDQLVATTWLQLRRRLACWWSDH